MTIRLSTITNLLLVVILMTAASSLRAAEIYASPATNSTGALIIYDTETDTETTLDVIQGNMAMDFDGSGNLWGLNGDSLYSIDPVTGTQTLIGSGTYNGSVEGLTWDGTRLVAGTNGVLYEVSTSDGSSTVIGNYTGFSDIDGLTTSPVELNTVIGTLPAGTLFACDSGSIYAIDTNTLVATLLFSSVPAQEALAFDADGTLYINDSSNGFYTIDLVTGSSTLVGGPAAWGAAIQGSAAPPAPPPGPAAPIPSLGGMGTLLLILALLALGAAQVNRRY